MRPLSTVVGVVALALLAALGPAWASDAATQPGPGSTAQPGHQTTHQMSDGSTMNGGTGRTGGDMSGMDMSSGDMSGMDMSGGTSAPATAGSGDMAGMPGMTHDDAASTASHPRSLVLAIFAVVNGIVLIAAATLRRRTAADSARKRAARAAGLGAPASAAGNLS